MRLRRRLILSAATAAWQENPSDEIAFEVHRASEPRRQELIRLEQQS